MLELVALGGFGVSALRDIQNPTGCDPEQHSQCDPALSRTFGLGDLQSTLLTSVFL